VLLGGFLGGSAQVWLWGLTILLDFMAATVSTEPTWWTLHAEHFAQRHGLTSETGITQTRLARDTYTFGHFPMLCGVIAYAVALEDALAHPLNALPDSVRLAMALGLVFFLRGTAFGMWRATGHGPLPRVLIAAAAAAGVYFAAGVMPIVTLSIAFAGVAAIAVMDERRAQRLKSASA